MIAIHTCKLSELPSFLAIQCVSLCHEESEMQSVFRRIASQSMTAGDSECFLAYAWVDRATGVRVVGWVCVSYWLVGAERRAQVQMFVAEEFRQRRLATAMCACLHDEVTTHEVVAVFSPEALTIARRLGWRANQYRSVDDGWIGVGSTDGEFSTGGHDAAGVHAAPSAMCDLPLACGEEGQDS